MRVFLKTKYALFFAVLAFLSIDQRVTYKILNQSYYWEKSFGKIVIFRINYFLNKNVAFGVPMVNWLLWPILAVMLFVLFKMFYKSFKSNNLLEASFLSLIITGALSNIWDRLIYGGVVDYLDITFLGVNWPVFNPADILIVSGVLGWLFWSSKKYFYEK